jgi:D-sedoheptulose 7-phosphate isomerase
MMREELVAGLKEGLRLGQYLLDTQQGVMLAMAHAMAQSLKAGGRVYFAGNGGSAGDSQHLATELVVRLRSDFNRPALAGQALTTDTSLLTACANDYGFAKIFSRQLEAFAKKGDCLFLLSTSGNSSNLIEALEVARERQLLVISLLGGSGGQLKGLSDHEIILPSDDSGRVQEAHIRIGHLVIQCVEQELF